MTLRELFQEFAIAKDRATAEHNREMRLVWAVAALTRVDKLPPLDALLVKPPQTMAEQRAVLAAISARFGIPTRKVRWTPQQVA